MSLYEPYRPSQMTQGQFDYDAITQKSGWGEYAAAKFVSGFDVSLLGASSRASQDISSGIDRFGPLPQGLSLEDAKARGYDTEQPRLTEEQYKNSNLAREGLKYEGGALDYERRRTEAYDKRRYNDSIIARYDGGFLGQASGFVAMLLGGGISPENFIPFVGPATRAAMSARMGVIGAHALLGAGEAMLGTTIADMVALPDLARRGENVGASDFALDLALGAAIGTAAGSFGGLLERRRAGATALRLPGVPAAADMLEVSSHALDSEAPVAIGSMFRSVDGLVERGRRAAGDEVGTLVPGAPPHEVTEAELDAGTTVRVYHGSPHRFERFGMEHIGKGEGAQAFGHGLYFAENEGVARSYREALSQTPGAVEDWFRKAFVESRPPGGAVEARLRIGDTIKYESPETLYADIRSGSVDVTSLPEPLAKALDERGSLYTVDLHVSRDELLDWDKPLSEQPAKVREGLKNWIDLLYLEPTDSGRDIYRAIEAELGSEQPNASAALLPAGIKGIQYLDAGSRAGAEGTRNIVMFDEAAIRIREINGRPIDLTTTAAEEPPHPSVVAAEASYKTVPPDFTAAQNALIKEGGLDAETSAQDLKTIDQMRRHDELTAEDETWLTEGDEAAEVHEREAAAAESLIGCATRLG